MFVLNREHKYMAFITILTVFFVVYKFSQLLVWKATPHIIMLLEHHGGRAGRALTTATKLPPDRESANNMICKKCNKVIY